MRLDTIGVLIDILDEEYQNQLFAGAAAAGREWGARVVAFVGGALDGPESLRFGMHRNFTYDLATPASVDALLISAGTLVNVVGPERLADWVRRFEPLPLCTLSVPLPGIPCVSSDNASGMRTAVTSLIVRGGFRRIVCLRGPMCNPEAEARYSIFRSVLHQHDLPLISELVVVGGFERDAAARGIGELLKRGVAFDAVMACNDLMALGALEACLAHGRRVPEDIALIGFDDTPDGRFAEVPLSTVRQSIHGLGYAGVKLLLDRIHGRSAAQHVVLPTELVLRRSFDPAHEDPPDSVTTGADLATTLARRRPALIERLARVTTQAGALFDLFAAALTQRSPAELMRGACALASRDHEIGEDTGGWHPALSTLERESAAYIAGHPELAAFNREFWLQLRVRLAEIGERFRARCLIAKQRELAVLRRIGEGLLTTLDTEHIMKLLASELSNLKLESCHIVLFDRHRLSDEADIVLVWDARTRRVDLSPKRIASRSLLPGTPRFADHASNLIVEPLYFEQEQLGFAVFEMGPADGTVYETLREQTSSAIKRARLVAQLLQQTKLRERAEQGQLHKEVEIAMKLQTSILPREMRVDGLDLAGRMSPVSEVGGDYYDVIAVPGGCWIGIGDVAGHGLQAGLVMLMLQSMLGALVHSVEPSPHTVVSAMNVALCRNIRERLDRKDHATLTILRYERNGRVRFAGAHEEILIFRSATGSVELVSTPGTWVGIAPDVEFEECELELGDGDVMLLYTDGVIEARSPTNVLFGMDRLCQLLLDVAREPAQVICDRVLAAVFAWAPVPQDDVTVLVARHLASASVARLS